MTRTDPNTSDRILAKTVLWLVPRFVTPNHITILRFLSIPFIVYLLLRREYHLAFPIFALSAFTDALDGALARTRGQITEWGKLFDPMADKILIASSAVVLIVTEMSFLLGIIMISVDAALAFAVVYQYNVKKQILSPHWTGKTKMFLQSLGLSVFLLSFIAQIPFIELAAIGILYFAVCFGLLSLFIYHSS